MRRLDLSLKIRTLPRLLSLARPWSGADNLSKIRPSVVRRLDKLISVVLSGYRLSG
jgi:hypothetical protein